MGFFLALCYKILKRIPDFIEFSKKYGFEMIRRNGNSFVLRADDLKLINNKYDNPIHFPSLDFSNYMGKFFHISKTSPDIIMSCCVIAPKQVYQS